MGLPLDTVVYFNDQIVGFSGERVDTRGYIDLDTKFDEGNECCKNYKSQISASGCRILA